MFNQTVNDQSIQSSERKEIKVVKLSGCWVGWLEACQCSSVERGTSDFNLWNSICHWITRSNRSLLWMLGCAEWTWIKHAWPAGVSLLPGCGWGIVQGLCSGGSDRSPLDTGRGFECDNWKEAVSSRQTLLARPRGPPHPNQKNGRHLKRQRSMVRSRRPENSLFQMHLEFVDWTAQGSVLLLQVAPS